MLHSIIQQKYIILAQCPVTDVKIMKNATIHHVLRYTLGNANDGDIIDVCASLDSMHVRSYIVMITKTSTVLWPRKFRNFISIPSVFLPVSPPPSPITALSNDTYVHIHIRHWRSRTYVYYVHRYLLSICLSPVYICIIFIIFILLKSNLICIWSPISLLHIIIDRWN